MENVKEQVLDFRWEFCGKSHNGDILTYKAKLEDGTMYLTISPLAGMSKVYVPDEVYVVDDTDYSKDPGPVAPVEESPDVKIGRAQKAAQEKAKAPK